VKNLAALSPFIIAWVTTLIGIAAVGNVIAQLLLFWRIRTFHRETWLEVGSPTLFAWPYGTAGKRYKRLVRNLSRHRPRRDRVFDGIYRTLGVTGYAVTVLFITYWVLRAVNALPRG